MKLNTLKLIQSVFVIAVTLLSLQLFSYGIGFISFVFPLPIIALILYVIVNVQSIRCFTGSSDPIFKRMQWSHGLMLPAFLLEWNETDGGSFITLFRVLLGEGKGYSVPAWLMDGGGWNTCMIWNTALFLPVTLLLAYSLQRLRK